MPLPCHSELRTPNSDDARILIHGPPSHRPPPRQHFLIKAGIIKRQARQWASEASQKWAAATKQAAAQVVTALDKLLASEPEGAPPQQQQQQQQAQT